MKNKRLASGLSQGELASLTHVSRYSINRFENGKANASKETQNIILRCLNYYVCDKPFYLLVDYLSVRFPTTDALEVIRKVLGMKADYFIHYDYGNGQSASFPVCPFSFVYSILVVAQILRKSLSSFTFKETHQMTRVGEMKLFGQLVHVSVSKQ